MSIRAALAAAVVVLAAAVVVLAAGAGCAPPPNDQKIEFRVPVLAEDVKTGTVEDRVVATGTLRALETVTLRTETQGILEVSEVEGRRLTEGQRVTAGDTIAEITGEEVRLAARTESTSQRYQQTSRDYESKKRLYDDGLLSEQALIEVESALADAKLALEQSRLTEARSRLVTPLSGIILRLCRNDAGQPMADGQLVNQGFVVAEIAPTNTLVADVDLVGSDVSRVSPNQLARVRHHAWDDEIFSGRVLQLAPTLDPVTRTLRAEVAIENDGQKLRPGMFVEVTVISERHVDVPVVPREALTERNGRKVVFVVRGQRVERREVVTGLGDDEVVEITHGVEVDERVVVRGLETLTDETLVRVSGS